MGIQVARRPNSRDCYRHGRRFRYEELSLSRIWPGVVGGPAGWATRPLDRRSQRGVPCRQPGARSGDVRGVGIRFGESCDCPACRYDRQFWRLRRVTNAITANHRECSLGDRGVCHPERRKFGQVCLHQHGHDRVVSWCRPFRGDLCDRTTDGQGSWRTGAGASGFATAESGAGNGHALHHPIRVDLRFR